MQPVGGLHGRGSEFFRINHGHEEVAKQGEGDEPDEDGFHGGVGSEGAAVAGVERAQGEEREGSGEEDQVGHGGNAQVFPDCHDLAGPVVKGPGSGVKNA